MSDTYRDSIEALLKIRHQNPLAGMPGHYAVQYREGARAIIDAIRMGEVPTIYHLSQIPGVREYEARHDQDRQVIAGLRAEVEREKARADEMKGDGERAVMEERNRTAKATTERDRLVGLLREIYENRQLHYGMWNIDGATMERTFAALSEIGGGK